MTIKEENHDKFHRQELDGFYPKNGNNFFKHLSEAFPGTKNQVYPWGSTFSFKPWHNIPVKFSSILWPCDM